jgi:hypothetical protein
VCDAVTQGLNELRDTLSNDLSQFVQSQRQHTGMSGQCLSDFLGATNKLITGTIDDFQNGFAGGNRLAKDPLVSVISQITNSPGAVLQSGVGNNVQTATTSAFAPNNVRSALLQFLNSQDVQGLAPDDKQSVADVAEVLGSELDKSQPDTSKITRWGRRLVEMAERLGIGVAASGLSHALFG